MSTQRIQNLQFQQQLNHTDERQVAMQVYETEAKSPVAYLLLALTFGSLGMQYFYTRNWLRGILCIFFSWTYIPLIIGLYQFMAGDYKEVTNYNVNQAATVAMALQVNPSDMLQHAITSTQNAAKVKYFGVIKVIVAVLAVLFVLGGVLVALTSSPQGLKVFRMLQHK